MTDVSLGARYESLIRLSAAVRSNHDGRELFELLARELRRVVPFDAIAQYDDRPSKVNWHVCADMPQPSETALGDLATIQGLNIGQLALAKVEAGGRAGKEGVAVAAEAVAAEA